jgi:Ca2+-binding RTX toxin-like protein
MVGTGGNDTFLGSAGADTMRGGKGTDTVDYSSSPAGVTVLLDLARGWLRLPGTGSGGDAAGDRLYDIENIVGSSFSDTLNGNAERNRLDGGAGNDRLTGDFLPAVFGSSADTFVFKRGYDVDTITDFQDSRRGPQDIVELAFAGFDEFADLQAPGVMRQVGSATHIDFGDGDILILQGIRVSQLDKSDFSFIVV